QLNYLFDEYQLLKKYENYEIKNISKFTNHFKEQIGNTDENYTNFPIFYCDIDLSDEKDNKILINGNPNIKLLIAQNSKNIKILETIQNNFFSDENLIKLNNGIVLYIVIF